MVSRHDAVVRCIVTFFAFQVCRCVTTPCAWRLKLKLLSHPLHRYSHLASNLVILVAHEDVAASSSATKIIKCAARSRLLMSCTYLVYVCVADITVNQVRMSVKCSSCALR
jgi:hypothetical protein